MEGYPFFETAVWSGVWWFLVAYVVTRNHADDKPARLLGVALAGVVGFSMAILIGLSTNIPTVLAPLLLLVAVIIGEKSNW